jgi:hypothetical protein
MSSSRLVSFLMRSSGKVGRFVLLFASFSHFLLLQPMLLLHMRGNQLTYTLLLFGFWLVQLTLLSEQASSSQSAGRSSQLIDDRWSSKGKGKGKDGSGDKGGGGGGAGTISLTPELIRDIFDEFPEVQEAYGENVPHVSSLASFLSLCRCRDG